MRAAYELERAGLFRALEEAGRTLNVLFVYWGGRDARYVSSQRVREDMSRLCRTLGAAAGENL
jgi:hypothetical protein